MDVTAISQLIGSLGFPIVCCFFMWKYINDTLKEVSETLNRNTVVLEKLLTKLDADEHEKKGE